MHDDFFPQRHVTSRWWGIIASPWALCHSYNMTGYPYPWRSIMGIRGFQIRSNRKVTAHLRGQINFLAGLFKARKLLSGLPLIKTFIKASKDLW